jgi:FkbM family methyltransferase
MPLPGPIRRVVHGARTLQALRRPPGVASQAELERIHDLVLQRRGFGTDNAAVNGEERALRQVAGGLPADGEVVVFDVGANRGDFAARALAAVGQRARIHCFEPSPAAFAELARRFESEPRIRLANVGLSDDDRDAVLYGDAAGSTLGSLYRREIAGRDIAFEETEQVTLRRLDEICAELGIERIDYLKVDAEGHDVAVLGGCGALLDGERIGAVQFEHGGTAMDARIFLRDFFDLLEPAYVVHRILPDGLWPIRPYREREEIAVYANYLALPR